MNSFELVPTEENLIKSLETDILKRNKDLIYFYNFLMAQDHASAIALDGRWGSGKTFFVKQLNLLINAKNPLSTMNSDLRESILSLFSNQETMKTVIGGSIGVYYDAWQNDGDSDPILSLIYEITRQLGLNYNVEDTNIFDLAVTVLDAFKGINIKSIIESINTENALTIFKKEKDIHEQIKDYFKEFLEERGNRLVVFIDELDRCNPKYAVQLLERIKHYLFDDRITFVFSVNLDELQHTIKHNYGSSFDACRYLDRFFDFNISLPPAEKNMFYEGMGLNSIDTLEYVCKKIIKAYSMELREITRFYQQVKMAVYKPTHYNSEYRFLFSEGKAKEILLMYIVPLLIGLKIVNISLYNEFVSGKNSKPLIDLYSSYNYESYLIKGLLNREETYEITEGRINVTIKEKLQELYDAIFVTEYVGNNYHTILGDFEFNSKSKEYVLRATGMFSKYAEY